MYIAYESELYRSQLKLKNMCVVFWLIWLYIFQENVFQLETVCFDINNSSVTALLMIEIRSNLVAVDK